MVIRKRKFTIPEYREQKEIYELLSYKEIDKKEKGIYYHVTFQIDETSKNYHKLKAIERQVYPKGPPFLPIILFVVGAFVLLSIFIVLFVKSINDKTNFDYVGNVLSFFIPAFSLLLADVIYTYFYFKIHRAIIDRGRLSKEQIIELVQKVKEEE